MEETLRTEWRRVRWTTQRANTSLTIVGNNRGYGRTCGIVCRKKLKYRVSRGETRLSSATGCLRMVQITSVSGEDDLSMFFFVVSEDRVIIESFRSSSGGISFVLGASMDFLRGLGGSWVTDSSLSFRFPAFGPGISTIGITRDIRNCTALGPLCDCLSSTTVNCSNRNTESRSYYESIAVSKCESSYLTSDSNSNTVRTFRPL